MKSESQKETDTAVRKGFVVKGGWLLFARERGGDLLIEPGDYVELTVKRSNALNQQEKQANATT